MKPIRLELQGFTAFREETVVDFEGRTLFAIIGPTGSGKSSLLDAMTWALYGSVARVGSSTRQLISHGASSMQVRFDFSTRDGIYRVVRKAPANTGTRLEKQQADGNWRSLADRSRDVTREVTNLLGMDFTTFTRTVLLPQGEFDAFLKGEQSERRQILTRLLGLGIYDDARKIANDRAKRSRERASTIEAQLEQLQLASPERIAQLEAEHSQVEQRLVELRARRETLGELGDVARTARDAERDAGVASEAATTAARAVTEAEQKLTAATAALAAARERCDALSKERVALQYEPAAHRALEQQVQHLQQRAAAETKLAAARKRLAESEVAHSTAELARTAAAAALTEVHAKQLAEGTTRDTAIASLALAVTSARAALEQLEVSTQQTVREQQAAQQEQDSQLARARRLDDLGRQFAERHAVEQRVTAEVTSQREARAQVATTSGQAATALEQAEATLLTKQREHEQARHADTAAALRAELQAGDPCPVCGEPIAVLPAAVDANELHEASRAVEEAQRLLAEQRERATKAATALAAADARIEAGTRELESAVAALTALDAELAEVGANRERLTAATEETRKLVATAKQRSQLAEQTAKQHADQVQAFHVQLAKVPNDVTVEPPAAECEPAENTQPLESAIQAFLAARRTYSAIETEAGEISRAATAAEAEQKRLGELAEAERRAVTEAERRLTELGVAPDGEAADAIRASLAAAEQQAKRDAELETQIGNARLDIASAVATKDATEAEGERLAVVASTSTAASETAHVRAEEARSALASEWVASIDADSTPDFEALKRVMIAHQTEHDQATAQAGALAAQVTQAKRETSEAERMRAEVISHTASAELHSALGSELQGNRFIGYVQREAMQLLAADASFRLDHFTNGRYELAADENEFVVVDRLNGDEQRSVKTLSGGETFLASLALALALSEHLPQLAGLGGAISLQSLFLDEGFGSLDPESLDLAVQGLESLSGGQRMIGVISHVGELAERLPDQIEVVKQGNSSTVRT
jgi:DNA repair protein SbcC/Rad50